MLAALFTYLQVVFSMFQPLKPLFYTILPMVTISSYVLHLNLVLKLLSLLIAPSSKLNTYLFPVETDAE